MIIDYAPYLDGEEWPSESRTMASGKGPRTPIITDVWDMPPQHAVAALHKLVRWAKEYASSEAEEFEQEEQVRSTPLGRALTHQALGIKDFSPADLPDYRSAMLGNDQVARLLLRLMADLRSAEAVTIRQLGVLAEDLAMTLNDRGYIVVQDG